MTDEEKKEEVIVSEPKGETGGNPYHKGKGTPDGGEFTEAPDSGSGGSEESGASPSSSSETKEGSKPSPKDIISAFRKQREGSPKSVIENFRKQREAKKQERAPEEVDPAHIITLENFKEARQVYVDATNASYHYRSRIIQGEQFEIVKNHINSIVQNASIGCNFWFDKSMDNILRTGKILNQFCGFYGSGYNEDATRLNHYRAIMSRNTFGTRGVMDDEMNPATRLNNRKRMEKYGCLMDSNPFNAASIRIGTQYGDAFFIMNDDIRNRTTFTFGDSLGEGEQDPREPRDPSGIPSIIADGLIPEQTTWMRDRMHRILNSKKTSDLTRALGVGYIEVQMHGDIDISKDVYACSASYSNWNSERGRRAIPQLLKWGIKIFCKRPTVNYLEEITGIDDNGDIQIRKAVM